MVQHNKDKQVFIPTYMHKKMYGDSRTNNKQPNENYTILKREQK